MDQLNQAFQQATFQSISRPAGWVVLQQQLQSSGDAAAGWASPCVQIVPRACRISAGLKTCWCPGFDPDLLHRRCRQACNRLQQHQVLGRWTVFEQLYLLSARRLLHRQPAGGLHP
jgi:hypothetical protein